jgi:hypothetical protein
LLIAAASGATVLADRLDSGATVAQPALRVDRGLDDVAVVFDVQEVDPEVVVATFRAAEQVGAAAAPARTASVGMRGLFRGGSLVHAPPDGWLIPFVLMAMPRAALGDVVGRDIPGQLDAGTVMINELTAQATGAQAGDSIVLRAADGSSQTFTIVRVLPYAQIGGSELLMLPEASARLGVVADTQMVVWNIASRSAFEEATRQVGLVSRSNTKVEHSWDPRDPDDSLSTARAKALMGEPWYRVVSDTTIEMHPAWRERYLPSGRVLLSDAIQIWARCHVGINAGLRAALDEVAAAGLGGAIDLANTNTYGGCFNARYSRSSGFLSRHAYAMALDMNTVTNCQGCVPAMNCSVVRIFRKHGFAWGGNWRQPDGMHFEWVGEPRDRLAYPSRYCPNTAATLTQSVGDSVDGSAATVEPIGSEVLTAGFEDSMSVDSGFVHG